MKHLVPALIAAACLALVVYLAYSYIQKKPTNVTITPTQTQVEPTDIAVAIGMANPASVNCEKVEGTSVIKTKPDGSQYGICDFGDDQMCEEWALMRGECPVGGVKITGYDNEAQIFCAISGGQTLAVPDAQCTLPDGTVCSVDAYYSGACSVENNVQ